MFIYRERLRISVGVKLDYRFDVILLFIAPACSIVRATEFESLNQIDVLLVVVSGQGPGDGVPMRTKHCIFISILCIFILSLGLTYTL